MFKLFLPLYFVFFTFSLQAQVPHLSGKAVVDMQTGQITCDFTISNIPDLGKDYQLLLNKGFNIKHLKNAVGEVIKYDGFYNGKMRGEGLVYTPSEKKCGIRKPETTRYQLHWSLSNL
ncbi:MAG: hypothetical protein REI64_04410 [Pedobacter sp.]|uniref:hypothetical protein n=1 Tax=Pedobacter sp. TaxID=1411316 RepID=UPI0028088C27|nr:hypothetical protein [Pedobacter sp.]MDQ8004021.1 hypothetical protein [Pedobacter sp.]